MSVNGNLFMREKCGKEKADSAVLERIMGFWGFLMREKSGKGQRFFSENRVGERKHQTRKGFAGEGFMAEGQGFEPRDPVKGQRFSSLDPKTIKNLKYRPDADVGDISFCIIGIF
jgi:hypothetical protein